MTVKLTPRQVDVILLLAQGYSNKNIARELNIRVDTVKAHIYHMFVKLRVDSRLKLAIYARNLKGNEISEDTSLT